MAKQTQEDDFQLAELADGSVAFSGLDPLPEEEEISLGEEGDLPKEPVSESEDDEDEQDSPFDSDAVKAKREARRQERKAKKLARQRELEENRQLRETLILQQQRIDHLSQKTYEGERFLIQREIDSLNSTIDYARRVKIEAQKNEDWGKVDEAERVIENVTRNKVMTELRLQQLGNEPVVQQPVSREQPRQEGDPVAYALAQSWALRNNSWFDPDGTDADSVAAKQVDQEIFNEGMRPNDPNYWATLDARLRKKLPHRYGGQSRTPHIGGLSQNRNIARGETVVPKEYVSAMKEAGLWDDPEKRKRALANYRLQQAKQRLEK